MNGYSVSMLLLFFYIYGFLGWVYESIYVSLKSRKIVNRGFVKGPILPIYGLGATIIVFSTNPFVNYPVAVFFVGMINATVLEYISGFLLEKIFKVRYWDYTGYFGNIKGYICFISVVVWGAFSLFTVYFLHENIIKLISEFDLVYIDCILLIISVIFIIDLVNSFKAAYDIRVLSQKIEVLFAEIKAENEMKLEKLKQEIKVENEMKLEKFRNELADAIERTNVIKKFILKGNPKAKFNSYYKNKLAEIKEYIQEKNKQ